MNAGSAKRSEIDDLLRRALADDLPAEVEAEMRRRIARFREAKAESEATKRERIAAARAWLFRRSVWAALSLVLLATGILLQGGKASSPLADRIAAIKTEFASLETTRR
jgi:hypothetical protein